MIRLDGVFGHELSRTTEQFQWSEGMISQGLHYKLSVEAFVHLFFI